MRPRLLFTAVLLLGFSAFADDASVPMAGYRLKNRSSFDPGAVKRPPFWPIGWVHHAGPVQEVAKVVVDPKQFNVTSILIGHPSVAVINGRTYFEGDLIRPPRGVKVTGFPRIRVKAISDGSVTMIADDQLVTIPLKRPELNEHKPSGDEDALLNNQ